MTQITRIQVIGKIVQVVRTVQFAAGTFLHHGINPMEYQPRQTCSILHRDAQVRRILLFAKATKLIAAGQQCLALR